MFTVGVLLWVLFALIIGMASRDRLMGFWGGFILSLFISPVICLIVLVITARKRPKPPEEEVVYRTPTT